MPRSTSSIQTPLPLIGWREWLALPELGILRIKAKIDTGARTSALHAFYVDPFHRGKTLWVRFGMHPLQHCTEEVIDCEAPVKDRRVVADSGGHRQRRYVIETPLCLGDQVFPAEITLTNRDSMLFRMLVGRTALTGRFLVDAQQSFLFGRPPHHIQP